MDNKQSGNPLGVVEVGEAYWERLCAQQAERIEQLERELARSARRHESLVAQLLESNRAMAALARGLEKMRMESERSVARRIRVVAKPILEKMSQEENLKAVSAELGAVVEELDDLAAGMGDGEGMMQMLTPGERRVAMMVKSGMNSVDIGDSLHIALDTVKTHRRNIRRKLGLSSRKINLRAYLLENLGRDD